jgi:hypothetical protein
VKDDRQQVSFYVRYWRLVSTVTKGEIMPQITGHLETLYFTSLKTDFGWIRPISNGQNLIRLDWNQTGWDDLDHPDNVSRETKSQLEAFFAGHLHQFNLPLAPVGKSAAGKQWLEVMARIPYGTVMTYGEFAALAGKPKRHAPPVQPVPAIRSRLSIPVTALFAPMAVLAIMGGEVTNTRPIQIIWRAKVIY